MTRKRAALLIAVIAILGVVSCSDQTPFQPLGLGVWPVPPTPPTPLTSSGPADSLLEANRALWASSGVDSYRYRFRWQCFCMDEYVRVVDITVMNGAIVSVVDASTGRPVSEEAAAYYRTIEGLFEFLRVAIDYPADSFHSTYDANLGYPVETQIDYVTGIADEELNFQIYGLSPVLRP